MCPLLLWSVGAGEEVGDGLGHLWPLPYHIFFLHPPQPKLSALKARKNVESFLEACRKMGVPEVWGLLSKEWWHAGLSQRVAWMAGFHSQRVSALRWRHRLPLPCPACPLPCMSPVLHVPCPAGPILSCMSPALHAPCPACCLSCTPAALHSPCPARRHVGVVLAPAREGRGGRDCPAAAADICPLSLSICSPLPQADLCSPSDLLQGTAQGLRTVLEAVKRVGGKALPPLWPPSGLGGFVIFYVVLMLLLYVSYTRLLGS